MYNSIFLFDMVLTMSELWFCLIFFFLFLEMGHPGLLYFLSFSCGALCSYVATLYGASVSSQLILFGIGTCIALVGVHRCIQAKKNQLQPPSHRSNLEALIGKKVTVYRSLHAENIWQVKIAGQVWVVKSVHDEPLQQGQEVVILDIQGCHLRVDKIHQ